MKNKKYILSLMILVIVGLFIYEIDHVFAQYQYSPTRFSGSQGGGASYVNYGSAPGYQSYFQGGGKLSQFYPNALLNNPEFCEARQDIIIQVSPAGCQPSVVRSDLLAEQNVPVFCQLDALKINPLIDVEQIRNIRFSGPLPDEVAGVGFYPARAALRSQNRLIGSPVMDNIGYVVVLLKQNEIEEDLDEFVEFPLTAQIDYYSGNAFGIGGNTFYLQPYSEFELNQGIGIQTFLQGQYSIGLTQADSQTAFVQLYQGDLPIGGTINVQRTGGAREINLPGSYCQVGMRVYYDGFESADKVARLKVDGDIIEVNQGGKFLNNKCTVNLVEGSDVHGNVSIICGRERFTLGFQARYLEVGAEVDYNTTSGEVLRYYIIAINQEENQYIIEPVDPNGGGAITALPKEVIPIDDDILFEREYEDEALNHYITEAIENLEEVSDTYPYLRDPPSQAEDLDKPPYGEAALERAIVHALAVDKEATAIRLIEKFIQNYPTSPKVKYWEEQLARTYTRENSGATFVVDINNRFQEISLLGIRSPKLISKAQLTWGTSTFFINENKDNDLDFGNITLNEVLDTDRVKVTAQCSGQGQTPNPPSIILNKFDQEPKALCGQSISVSFIEVQKLAKIRLEPNVRTHGETEFMVGVGIEKRAIQLSPEKTRQRVENLEETIEKWQSISESLNNINSGLQAACFATAGLLTVKNFFTGLGGEALARQNVMRGEDGWTEWCSEKVNQGDFTTLTACYNDPTIKQAIENDVQTYEAQYAQTNGVITGIENDCKHPQSSDPLLGGGSLDLPECREKMKAELLNSCGSRNITLSDGTTKSISELLATEADKLNYHQMRDLYLHCSALGSGDLSSEVGEAVAIENLQNLGDNFNRNLEYNQRLEQSQGIVNEYGVTVTDTRSIYPGHRMAASVTSLNENAKNHLFPNLSANVSSNSKMVYLPMRDIQIRDKDGIVRKDFDGGSFIARLEPVQGGSGEYQIRDVVAVNEAGQIIQHNDLYGNTNGDPGTDVIRRRNFAEAYEINVVENQDSLNYVNQFLPEEATVRFYEHEPFRGQPAIVPIDQSAGWYVATRPKLQGFGSIEAVESSGRPSSFWLCNVMKDREVDFFTPGFDDDKCARFDFNTGQPQDVFPGLGASPAFIQDLVSCGKEAIRQAQDQYDSGETVSISCPGKGQQVFSVGQSAATIPGTQCQDFMSPDDCLLLFNVCDPVICPSSRCNFGGAYQVPDVVSSGIVGSALLCLPNINDPVLIPVCLTGIQAGIDNYISILQQHQACLIENIETGRNIGICDMITSVYTCEFFWRQAAPIADSIIPKAVEFLAYGGQGNVVGGGEYLTVNSAWQNAKDSVDFFTESYAVNAFEAFNVRSYQEAGTTFCQNFISAKGPDVFETLIEPQSPPQFTSWFSEIPLQDVSTPPFSQYKVFYHIFAGNDAGVQYSIKLIDGPAGTHDLPVSYDFVPRGQSVSETRDFQAPKGFKQLCVSINGEEECGFKQVSTSFALNVIRDELVQGVLTDTDIQTEDECVSGKVNTLALLNPNIEEAFQEAIDPAIYNRGITRICASGNPGQVTDGERFVRVGDCGHPNVGCWLDKLSIDQAITTQNVGAQQETYQDLNDTVRKLLIENADKNFYDDEDYRNEYQKLKDEMAEIDANNPADVLQKIEMIDIAIGQAFWDYQTAELKILKGETYAKVAEKLKGADIKDIDPQGADLSDPPQVVENGYKFINVVENCPLLNKNNCLLLHSNGNLVNKDNPIEYQSSPYNGIFSKKSESSGEVFDRIAQVLSGNIIDIIQNKFLSFPVDVRNYMAAIDGGLINGDNSISTCKIYFVKDNQRLGNGEQIEIVSPGGLFLEYENCDVSTDSTLSFSYDNPDTPSVPAHEFHIADFTNNKYEIVLSSNQEPGSHPLALGTFTVLLLHYDVQIDSKTLKIGPSEGNDVYFFVENM